MIKKQEIKPVTVQKLFLFFLLLHLTQDPYKIRPNEINRIIFFNRRNT